MSINIVYVYVCVYLGVEGREMCELVWYEL